MRRKFTEGGANMDKKWSRQAKYNRIHVRRFVMNANTNTDADIIRHLQSLLDSGASVNSYFKELIRRDMKS